MYTVAAYSSLASPQKNTRSLVETYWSGLSNENYTGPHLLVDKPFETGICFRPIGCNRFPHTCVGRHVTDYLNR